MLTNNNELHQEAMELWGVHSLMIKMIEEMSELTTEFYHELYDRGSIEAIMEKLADVEIMLEQMKVAFPSIQAIKKRKLERLASLIDREKDQMKNNWGGTLIGPDHEKAEVVGRVFKKALS